MRIKYTKNNYTLKTMKNLHSELNKPTLWTDAIIMAESPVACHHVTYFTSDVVRDYLP